MAMLKQRHPIRKTSESSNPRTVSSKYYDQRLMQAPPVSSRYSTGRISEAMLASKEVEELTESVLTPEELERVETLSKMIVSSRRQRKQAISELKKMVAPPPKRPLYYAQHELEFLPRWTRDATRYLGDYVDVLVKHLAFVVTGDKRTAEFFLGQSLKAIKAAKFTSVPGELIDQLGRYNRFLYRPSKHEFRLPSGRRSHRFTSKEVVLVVFITKKLASRIRAITNCNPQLNCHFDFVKQDLTEGDRG